MSLFNYVPANKDAALSIFKALHPISVYQNLNTDFYSQSWSKAKGWSRAEGGEGLRGSFQWCPGQTAMPVN